MDFKLSAEDRAVQARARDFTEKHLFPHEIACDERKLGKSTLAEIRQQVIAHKLNGYIHSQADGGQGYTPMQQILVAEEIGKSTCGMWTVVWKASTPLRRGTPWQRETFLLPFNAGKGRSCFAITEEGAGSDPSLVKTSAVRKNGKWVINGEKWFVTSADASTVVIVHAHVDGDASKPTLFIVDMDAPGVKIKRIPQFMHSYLYEHYEMVFDNVEVEDNRRLGEVGQGFDLTKEWFTETRVEIAAHCLGAAIRATEIANDYAAGRIQFGKPIRDFQAIEFMLADMAVEIMAAKSFLYRVGAELNEGMDPKLMHAKASALKLYNSEMAGRVVDKALQILGGRGYMRENPVERLYRDVRVDRIWEGTSEIQRVIIAGQIKKRGLGIYTGWAG
ncbi:acyl-CoA dehydrogenase family protein [Dongia sp.]|jgi:alkylation response protein AidB-like acyl-CoA dehydrogenase|uniref:acyl-CoA dehydrogenase family protein n=1 Tax=Dongia sp. TaxID=1977262 RepID=UPI0035B1CAAF